jgi:hypothetical protein
VIKVIALKCQTCTTGAIGHYQAAETGLLLHLNTVRSLAVIQIHMHVHQRQRISPSSAPTPASNAVLDSEIALLRRFWCQSRHSLKFSDHHGPGCRVCTRNHGGCMSQEGENLVSAVLRCPEAMCRLLKGLFKNCKLAVDSVFWSMSA